MFELNRQLLNFIDDIGYIRHLARFDFTTLKLSPMLCLKIQKPGKIFESLKIIIL